LKQLSQREGVTLFMTLLAGFKILLSRYTGQDDIVVGTPIANRRLAETEALIGFFLNTLAIRTRLEDELQSVELVRRVREAALGAYAHQDLPFEKLVEDLDLDRDTSRSPLFQVMMATQNVSYQALQLGPLSLTTMSGEAFSALFDILLAVLEEP